MSAKAKKPFLGLAILSTLLRPGEIPTFAAMRAFCCAAGEPISRERLRQIEYRALRKCRIRLKQRGITEVEVKTLLKMFG